jgi:DNA end-binding protein Ku
MAKKHHAYWKGYLRPSLVTIGVEICNAVESKSDISFRQIQKPSGRRIQYQKVVQGIGEIENSDIVKGYRVDTDTYITIDPIPSEFASQSKQGQRARDRRLNLFVAL